MGNLKEKCPDLKNEHLQYVRQYNKPYQENQAGDVNPAFDTSFDRFFPNPFYDTKYDAAAVQRGNGQQIKNAEIDGKQRQQP